MEEFVDFVGEPVGPEGDKFKPKRKALISATEMEGIKHKLLASSYTSSGADLRKLFSWLDRDGEGGIDYRHSQPQPHRTVMHC